MNAIDPALRALAAADAAGAAGAATAAGAAGSANRIFIRQLRLDARIGVLDWEKATPQPIVVDLEFALPSPLACITDRLEHTVDYACIVERLRALALERPCQLVEAMAEGMAQMLQREFGVPWLALTLTKLAPFPGVAVGITIERSARALSPSYPFGDTH